MHFCNINILYVIIFILSHQVCLHTLKHANQKKRHESDFSPNHVSLISYQIPAKSSPTVSGFFGFSVMHSTPSVNLTTVLPPFTQNPFQHLHASVNSQHRGIQNEIIILDILPVISRVGPVVSRSFFIVISAVDSTLSLVIW